MSLKNNLFVQVSLGAIALCVIFACCQLVMAACSYQNNRQDCDVTGWGEYGCSKSTYFVSRGGCYQSETSNMTGKCDTKNEKCNSCKCKAERINGIPQDEKHCYCQG